MVSVVSSSDHESSFTDTLQANLSSKGNRSLAYEQVKLSVHPEDPDFAPQEPEGHFLRHKRRGPRLEAPNCTGICTGACLCCLLLLLAFGLAALLATSSPLRRTGAARYLREQFLAAVRCTMSGQSQQNGGGGIAGGPGAYSAASVAARPTQPWPTTTTAAPPWTSSTPPMHGAFLDPLARSGEICNPQAPLPKLSLRKWDLPDDWQRACEAKNVQGKYPYERNWCWVGLNNMCHWNLKAHKSWASYQNMAARDGIAPPRSDHAFNPLEDPEICDRPANGRARPWTAAERATARQWFKEHVAVYVLSLPNVGDGRYKVINQRLNELEIWHTRVPGVDMRVPGALAAAKRQGFVPLLFNFSKAQTTAYSWKHNMGSILGTVGCAAAHFKVQTKVMADASPMAIVMEDDSWVTDDFVPRLWSLVKEELPCDWEVTALLSRCGYGKCVSPHLTRVMPDANEPEWRCHQGSNWGMHAVLYRVSVLPALQEKWKRTVFNEDRPHCMDVDVALASISDQVGFYAVPAVQDPGFVRELDGRSARWDINQAAGTTTHPPSTSTTSTITTTTRPKLEPGEPWPGAWSYQ